MSVRLQCSGGTKIQSIRTGMPGPVLLLLSCLSGRTFWRHAKLGLLGPPKRVGHPLVSVLSDSELHMKLLGGSEPEPGSVSVGPAELTRSL